MRQSVAQLIKIPVDYPELFVDLKVCIRSAQLRAELAINRELTLLCWEIGPQILENSLKMDGERQ